MDRYRGYAACLLFESKLTVVALAEVLPHEIVSAIETTTQTQNTSETGRAIDLVAVAAARVKDHHFAHAQGLLRIPGEMIVGMIAETTAAM